MSAHNKNILVIRLSSLGDVVLTTPVYKNIKSKWPDCKISVLVKPKFAHALMGNPNIDEVISFKGLFKTVKEINSKDFTHLLDLHSNLRTHFISTFCNMENKLRYKKHSLARKLFVKFRIPAPSLQKHTLDRYLDTLKHWDIPVISKTPELSQWANKPNTISENFKPLNICIIQTAFLGDAVLSIPLINKTHELFPSSKISIVTRPESADIFKSQENVSNVIIDDKRNQPKLKSTLTLIKNLKESKFDIALIPHRSFRSAFCAFMAKIPLRIGFSTSAGKMFLNKTVAFSWLLHDVERNLSLLNAVTAKELSGDALRINSPSNSKQKTVELLHNKGWKENQAIVGIHPGSAWATKRWPKEYFAKLISELWNKQNVKSVLIGGKNDFELCKEIAELSHSGAINLAGETSISDLISLMPQFKAFVTNDSGPMHIAVGSNIPTIGIFGPTTKELGFFPYGKKSRVLEVPLKCRPCALHGGKKCPHGHFLCMKLISVSDVYSAVCGFW
jgi:lipopolysaccharide heptosyltransferase II